MDHHIGGPGKRVFFDDPNAFRNVYILESSAVIKRAYIQVRAFYRRYAVFDDNRFYFAVAVKCRGFNANDVPGNGNAPFAAGCTITAEGKGALACPGTSFALKPRH